MGVSVSAILTIRIGVSPPITIVAISIPPHVVVSPALGLTGVTTAPLTPIIVDIHPVWGVVFP